MTASDPQERGRFSRFPPFLTGAFVYVFLLGYFYSFSKYGFNIWDEGTIAYGVLRTYNGQTSLKDFYGYPVGQYLWGALFFKLFGVSIQSFRLAIIAFTPAMVLMTYAIARKIMPSGFAKLAALFMLSAPSMYYTRYYPFFCLLNLYCLVEFLDRRRGLLLFPLIISIVVSFYFKVEVAVFSAAVAGTALALVVWKDRARGEPSPEKTSPAAAWMGSLVAGPSSRILIFLTAAGISASLVYVVKNNIVEQLLDIVFRIHGVWGNPFPEIFPFMGLFDKLGPHEMFERILFYLPIFVYVLTAILLLPRFFRKRGAAGTPNLCLFSVLAFGVSAFGLVIWRAGFDNLLRTLPPFYILVCYLLFRAQERLLGLLGKVGGANAFPQAKKAVAEVLILIFPLVFFYEMNVKHGFYAGTAGAIKIETVRLKMDRIDVYTNPSEAKWLREIVELVLANTKKGDPILALPLNAMFYFLTDRVNPTFYDWILPGMLGAEEENRVVNQIKANLPKIIIFVDIAIDGREERRLANYAPALFTFISGRYQLLKTIGFFHVLVPKDDFQPQAPPTK